jgi:uncharacterized protein (DUF2236 family)
MTCPVNHQPALAPEVFERSSAGDVADRFERVAGSVFVGLFAAGLFDQTMLPAVSAALEDTGRIRNAPWPRALRTAASEQIMFTGDEVDRREEAARLVRLHRDVKGVGANGVRYSALTPESWNWIMISTFFMHRNAFTAISGERLSAADDQAIWDRFRQMTEGLHLPGRSGLPENYEDLCAHYDHMVAEKLVPTSMLECVVAQTLRPGLPDFLPTVALPLWMLTQPVVGEILAVLGFGAMHPGARAVVPMTWTRRHDVEFTALTFLVRQAYRWLPTRITDTPLARNRREYQRLMANYKGIGLASFAPERMSRT